MSYDNHANICSEIGKSAETQQFLDKIQLIQWLKSRGVPATKYWIERSQGKHLPKCYFGNRVRFKISEVENYLNEYPIAE